MNLKKRMGKTIPALAKHPLVLWGFAASLLITAIATFSLILSFNSLPAKVPLLFTAEEALKGKWFLFFLPLLSLTFTVVNALASDLLIRREEKAAAIFPAFLSLFVSVIFSGSLVRIVRLFPIPPLPLEEDLYPLLAPFVVAISLGFVLTWITNRLARKFDIFDKPHGPYPQVRPIPRLGALPLFLTFAATALIFSPLTKNLTALLLGGAVIAIIQTIDDIRPLPPLVQGVGHILAGIIIVVGGVGVDFIRNPLTQWVGGDYTRLDIWEIPLTFRGITYQFTVLSDLFTIAWVFALVNVVDWIDGLDGLASGVGAIATSTIIAISIIFNTPITAFLGIILLGGLVGFLPFNFYPARIYLGGGAFLLGYFLAVLSIFSGAKTGTALLVLAIPIIDAFYVIYQRIRAGKSPFTGDKTHLHHRLLEVGLDHPKIVLLEWFVVAALAVAAVHLTGFSKLAAVALVFAGALLANKALLGYLGSKDQNA